MERPEGIRKNKRDLKNVEGGKKLALIKLSLNIFL